MNKALILTSIAISLLIYSLGLMIYGPFGLIGTRLLEEEQTYLESRLEGVEEEHRELETERQRLSDDEYVQALAQEYGNTAGERVIFFPGAGEDQDQTVPDAGERTFSREAPPSNTLLIAVSAAVGLIVFTVGSLILHRRQKRASHS